MTRLLFLTVLFSLMIFLISCGPEKSFYSLQKSLDINDIDSVFITRNTTDSTPAITKYLTADQSKRLVDKWNSASSIGPCKYKWEYYIDVHLKDMTKRGFRINKSTMKETTDRSFDLTDTSFVYQLWTSAK